ncbi:MAG: peptidoglycan DD-metalloendopeptidase family protein [Erysipelotrichaceae bacterium]
MKKFIPILVAFLLAIPFTYLSLTNNFQVIMNSFNVSANSNQAIIKQEVKTVSNEPHAVYEFYNQGSLIGIISDKDVFDRTLVSVYENNYAKDFPNSRLGIGLECYIVEKSTYNYYENIDNLIVDYVKNNHLFSIEANKVEFSNGKYAYVKNVNDFYEAKDTYVLNYIDKDSYELLKQNLLPPELVTYGTRTININIVEKATISKALAPIDQVLKDKNEILEYLSYGYGKEKKSYVTKEFDTLEGIAYLNGLEKQNLITINRDVLERDDQILKVGTKLNVTYFDSPINIVTVKENYVKETIQPGADTIINDPTLQQGAREVVREGQVGYRNVKYLETYINGKMSKGVEVSSSVIQAPVNGIVKVGTLILPGVGSGSLIFPVNGGRIICGWRCYYNHNGVDIQNPYNKYSPIVAADTGKLVSNSCVWDWGCNILIDHGNGIMTRYAHMKAKSDKPIGYVFSQGEQVGYVGMTGLTTAPHVHFEVYVGKTRVNPCLYLKC